MHVILKTFTNKVDVMCQRNEYTDALLWFNYLAFDVLSDLAFGEAIGMVNNVSYFIFLRAYVEPMSSTRSQMKFPSNERMAT